MRRKVTRKIPARRNSKPVIVVELTEDQKKNAIKKLIKRGKEVGFVTQEEILSIFPKAENELLALDDLYSKLLNEGVDVFDSTAQAEEEKTGADFPIISV